MVTLLCRADPFGWGGNKQVSFMFAGWGLISIINTNSDTNISNLKSRLKHHMEENTWGLYKSNNVMRNGRGGWNYWIGVQLPTIGNRYLVLSSASRHQIRICRLYKLESGVLLTIMRIMSMMGVTGPANPKGSMVSWDTPPKWKKIAKCMATWQANHLTSRLF